MERRRGSGGRGAACTLVDLGLGLGDSTDDAVEHSEVLWKGRKKKQTQKAGVEFSFVHKRATKHWHARDEKQTLASAVNTGNRTWVANKGSIQW